jgi:phosphoglycolate phosphatase-like HAD superfamily hydrolase
MSNTRLKVRGILLDLDGTILDTRDAYIEAAKNAFSALGQDLPDNGVALEIPKRIEQKLPFTDLMNVEPQKFLNSYLKAFYDISGGKTKPMPYIASALEKLSGKAKLAIITMRFVPKEVIIRELQQFHLDKYFTHVVTALDTHKPKPSPEALIKAVKALDMQMSDCVIVGDSVIDVQAGKAAGIKTVAVLSGLYSREELAQTDPNLIINNVAELPQFIE